VAGHRGLVGSALVRALNHRGHGHLLLRTRDELDLTNQAAVRAFFDAERPDVVILAAARVGGIYANNSRPALFIRDNLLIQDNVIDAAYRAGTAKFVFLGSSCIYPKLAPQPIKAPCTGQATTLICRTHMCCHR
jgi:GDP-L-fucose synthase